MSLTVTDKGNATTRNINGYEVYEFTTLGQSSVTFSGSGTIDLLVVGGAGGKYFKSFLYPRYYGGAGGFIEILEYPINAGAGRTYNIFVGESGSITINPQRIPASTLPSDGTTSSFDIIEAAGGGGGGGGKSVTSGKKGCGGSGGQKIESSATYIYGDAGNSNVSGISGKKVTYKSNKAASNVAGGADIEGKGIKSEIIDKMCSSAVAKSVSEGSYGSRVDNNITEGHGIVAFRISPLPTTAPTTMRPTIVRPTTMSPTIVRPTTMSPTIVRPTTHLSLSVLSYSGATVTTSNGYTIYTYTTVSGTNNVTFTGAGAIDLLVVGGGGALSSDTYGGAGGFIEILNYPISAGTYTITVGKKGIKPDVGYPEATSSTGSIFGEISAGGGRTMREPKTSTNHNYNSMPNARYGCGGSVFGGSMGVGTSNVSGLPRTSIVTYGCSDGTNSNSYGGGAGGSNGAGKTSSITGTSLVYSTGGGFDPPGVYGSGDQNGVVIFRLYTPTTVPPTTMSPTTMSPTTMSPTTMSPTTMAPTTMSPTTMSPTTMSPTTMSPTTMSPTTMAPTTMAPTTMALTSMAPTTISSTMPPTTPASASTTLIPTTPGSTTMAPTTHGSTPLIPTTPFPTILYNTPPVVPQLESLLKLDENLQTQLSNKTDEANQNFQQARLVDLNESYRKRYLEYIKLVMVAVLAGFFLWFFNILNQYEYLPSGIVDLFIIITVSLCVVYIYVIWTNIQTRDLLNYDEIDYAPPDTSTNKTNEQTVNSISPTPTTYNGTPPVSTQGCSNPVCPSGYKYSQQTKMCELDVNLDINKIGSLILGEIKGYL